jgi:general nucleoside transport system permease protein
MHNSMTYSPWKRFFIHYRTTLIGGLLVCALILISELIIPMDTVAVLNATVRLSTPLVLGALCGLMGERAAVINIGIEGQMLMAAFIAFLFNVWTGNLLLSILAGILTGALLGALLGFMAVTLKIDQIIGGTVINILALGLTGYFYKTGLTTHGKLHPIIIPGLSKIPLIGPVLFENPPITYATIILVFVIHYVLFFTKWGLRTRAVGEHPRAADTVGINIFMVRYVNVILGGGLAGLAGAFLTLEAVGSFERAMTNGRGFVALACMIFGRWTPFGAWGAALFFALFTALSTQISFRVGDTVNIPHQVFGVLPYLFTILVLAGMGRRARPPAADGVPYTKE